VADNMSIGRPLGLRERGWRRDRWETGHDGFIKGRRIRRASHGQELMGVGHLGHASLLGGLCVVPGMRCHVQTALVW
jgi:hypothetical protein